MNQNQRIHIFIFLLLGLVGFKVVQGKSLQPILSSVIPSIEQEALVSQQVYPLLTPASATCDAYWESIPTSNGLPGYITLNVNNPSSSTNSAEWRPDVPSDGLYRVEAFIPAPPPTVTCSKLKTGTQNTSQAIYKIHHAAGTTESTVNQNAYVNSWVNIGTYQFSQGSTGFVTLSDLNGETSLTRFVGFSALKFTSQFKEYLVYFPKISNAVQPIQEGSVVVRQRQAFDSCLRPSLAGMQAWWNSSPYYIYNIYMGGVSNSSCHPESLTASWIASVHAQGWEFIPTWVGPQAPCTSFKYRFSYDPQNAFGEGIQEANLAYSRALSLGLVGKDIPRSIFYYDMEAFYGGSAECRLAVQNFLSGWSQRLHELNIRSGVYGSSCYYMPDWKSLSNPLDDAWLASWYTIDHDNNPATPKEYFYDPYANVTNVACSASLTGAWSNHQRIRQYAGGHSENWGGVSVGIDSNITDGHVFTQNGLSSPDSVQIPADATFLPASSQVINEYQLVAATTGWIYRDGSLLLTEDNGVTWSDRSPDLDSTEIIAFYFQNSQSGWVLAHDLSLKQETLLQILRTMDGGVTWSSEALPVSGEVAIQVEDASFHFIDSSTGWLSLRLSSSSAFSVGLLFKTRDGGITWQDLTIPVGEPVYFTTNLVGWTAGGAAGDELYITRDGGFSWESAAFIQDGSGLVIYSLPKFIDPLNGSILVTIIESEGTRLEQYNTQDGGVTWSLVSLVPLDTQVQSVIAVPSDVTSNQEVIVADNQTNLLYRSEDGATQPMKPVSGGLPAGVVEITFITPMNGWAKTSQSNCTGGKADKSEANFSCSFREELWQTTDGGLNWQLMR